MSTPNEFLALAHVRTEATKKGHNRRSQRQHRVLSVEGSRAASFLHVFQLLARSRGMGRDRLQLAMRRRLNYLYMGRGRTARNTRNKS